MRPHSSPIFAICPNQQVADSLAMNRGVTPYPMQFDTAPEQTIDRALALLLKRGILKTGNTVVIIGALVSRDQMIDAVQMRVV
jgi:pyruvate kinase